VTWTLQSSWNAGYVADVTVSTSAAAAGWSISWVDPGASSVVNAWGMTCTVGGGRVRCVGADWAKSIPAGGTVRVGLQVAGNGQPPHAPVITVG
jgi:endoglucanase